ncbi:MAG: ABC transporter substrate-binding protein [Alphaproteobacteria bacterium]|nr:ABC transporter substrate-binding protein [Alphaproteobacteria bacterium]
MEITRRALIAATAATAAAAGPASAQAPNTLTIGVRSETSSLDPHWTQFPQDKQVEDHIFNRLVSLDHSSRPIPGLATAWKVIDDTTWEFELRRGVRWHDGQAFTADDVVFTFDRLRAGITGAPAAPSFVIHAGNKQITKIDDHTVRIKTNGPFPTMPEEMSFFSIVAKHRVSDARPSVDFNSGRAAIGTGPYKLAEFRPGERVVLERNPDFWGENPGWDRVVFRPITQDATRLAALMNGDVDIIDYPPTPDLPRLRQQGSRFAVSEIASDRVIYIQLSYRDVEPFVRSADGQAMTINPLRDVRVRQAMSLAINREAIRDRLMGGAALPTGNIVPPGFFGYSEALKADAFNSDRARQLLQQAGFGTGFRITLHGPNNRYINDQQIIEAVAQMWTRIGIQTEVSTMPRNIFFTDVIRGDPMTIPGFDVGKFSVWLSGWGTATGEATYTVRGLLESFNPEAGSGNGNWGRYTNARVDSLSRKARVTLEPNARQQALIQATEIGLRDYALIPIHFQVNNWAHNAGLRHQPRVNERTYAWDVTRAR